MRSPGFSEIDKLFGNATQKAGKAEILGGQETEGNT
jgi:hypothetical protein